jgi:hypothetical protein
MRIKATSDNKFKTISQSLKVEPIFQIDIKSPLLKLQLLNNKNHSKMRKSFWLTPTDLKKIEKNSDKKV